MWTEKRCARWQRVMNQILINQKVTAVVPQTVRTNLKKTRLSPESHILQPYQFEPACHGGNKEQGNICNPPHDDKRLIGVGVVIAI